MNKPKIIIVIQSRLSSSRLPAKAVLPLAGYPVVVLCALRAGNTGLPVIVATSDDKADETITAFLQERGIQAFRGSLDNVLARITEAVASYDDNDLIVRLTADNVFPDGGFITYLLHCFDQEKFDYLGTSSPKDGLPYGLSAELFKIGHLREANIKAVNSFDKEHVTPYIRRTFRCQPFIWENAPASWKNLRCTLDTYEDYLRLLHLFKEIKNPLAISWIDLVEVLEKREANLAQKNKHDRYKKFTLGTAQLGLPYGIANSQGLPKAQQTYQLVRKALHSGICSFDTARAYGLAEQRLGKALAGQKEKVQIISKLHPIDYLDADAQTEQVRNAVKASIYETCYHLKQETIDVILLHRWEHRYKWNEAAWNMLISMKEEGLIKHIGVSVTTLNEAIDALGEPEIKLIQCPVNILDWRWRHPSFLNAMQQRHDVIYHARSIYLQGLLLLDKEAWPSFEKINTTRLHNTLNDLAKQFHRKNRQDLCLAYVRGLPWVNSLVIGMETEKQLEENLDLFDEPPLTIEQIEAIHQTLEHLPEHFLNPALWNLHDIKT